MAGPESIGAAHGSDSPAMPERHSTEPVTEGENTVAAGHGDSVGGDQRAAGREYPHGAPKPGFWKRTGAAVSSAASSVADGGKKTMLVGLGAIVVGGGLAAAYELAPHDQDEWESGSLLGGNSWLSDGSSFGYGSGHYNDPFRVF